MDPIGRLLLLAIECRLGPGFRLNLGLMIGSTEPIWATARRIPGLPVFRLCAMCLCITDRLCCGFLSRSGSGFALVGCGCLLYLLAEVFGGSLGLLGYLFCVLAQLFNGRAGFLEGVLDVFFQLGNRVLD